MGSLWDDAGEAVSRENLEREQAESESGRRDLEYRTELEKLAKELIDGMGRLRVAPRNYTFVVTNTHFQSKTVRGHSISGWLIDDPFTHIQLANGPFKLAAQQSSPLNEYIVTPDAHVYCRDQGCQRLVMGMVPGFRPVPVPDRHRPDLFQLRDWMLSRLKYERGRR